jgi:hypothetical protein
MSIDVYAGWHGMVDFFCMLDFLSLPIFIVETTKSIFPLRILPGKHFSMSLDDILSNSAAVLMTMVESNLDIKRNAMSVSLNLVWVSLRTVLILKFGSNSYLTGIFCCSMCCCIVFSRSCAPRYTFTILMVLVMYCCRWWKFKVFRGGRGRVYIVHHCRCCRDGLRVLCVDFLRRKLSTGN